MSTRFNAQRGLIVVPVRLWGPGGDWTAQLALDTGATATVVRTAILVTIGCDPALAPDRTRMTTASGSSTYRAFPSIGSRRWGRSERASPLPHTLYPPSALIDGVLGLDFLRGQRLTVDFRTGQITLA